MYVSRGKDANPQKSNRDIFTGGVHQHPHIGESVAQHLRINLVHFDSGGRTKWHTHTFEQGLVVTEGKGIVATEAQEYVIEPGDVVVITAQEKHWHGATERTSMSHLSINGPGETTVLEPVEAIKTQDA